MNIETTNPLQWPQGWSRSRMRFRARYGDHSIARSLDHLCNELRLLGADNVTISSNLKPRLDGLPRSEQRQPIDPGVAVYFRRKTQVQSFACDKWDAVEHNIWAIAEGISAIRQLDRTGCSEILDRAFLGFAALPSPEPVLLWWEALEVSDTASKEEIEEAFRQAAKKHHPDLGGSEKKFIDVRRAYKEAMGR